MEKVKHPSRRSYGQYCALARALDVIGDRWNMLIVRELLPGPLRYGELKASLSGIATNLLSERLRSLEGDGVIERQVGDRGVNYSLTSWGAELREAMEALGRWGAPLVASGRGDDAFHPRWLVPALPALLGDATASPPVEIGLEVEGYLITVRIDEDGPHAYAPDRHSPDTVLAADPETIVGLAARAVPLEQALSMGRLTGDPTPLRRAFPPSKRQ